MIAPRSLAVLLAAACAAVLAGCGKDAPATPPAETGSYYVALGDSFTAVSGTGPHTDGACLRSEDDYPALVAEELKIDSFDDVSCGGATTAALTQTQLISGKGANQAQLNAVTDETRLVTLGIGLNDDGLSYYVLLACLPQNRKSSPACENYLKLPDSGMQPTIDKMAAKVAAGIDAVRERAPKARIVLVGYPRLLPDSGECQDQVPLPPVALERVRSALDLTDKALAGVAKTKDISYVDMYAASSGHDVCSASPWVNGFKNIAGKAYAFHPFASYHRAVAAEIVKLLGNAKPQA